LCISRSMTSSSWRATASCRRLPHRPTSAIGLSDSTIIATAPRSDDGSSPDIYDQRSAEIRKCGDGGVTEQPEDPSPPPDSGDERPAGRVSRRHLLGGAGLFGIGAAAGALAATAAHGHSGAHPTDDHPSTPSVPGTSRQRGGPLNVILVIRDQTRFDLP